MNFDFRKKLYFKFRSMFICVLLAICSIFYIGIAFSESLPNISQNIINTDVKLLNYAQLFYRDKEDSHLYHVLPSAYRVKVNPDGTQQSSIVVLPNGRSILSARLVPWPTQLEQDQNIKVLMANIRKTDPMARFVIPRMKNPRLEVLGPLAKYAESITISGTITATGEIYVIIKVPKEFTAQFTADLKHPLGVLGKIELDVRAFNGMQIIDWPVGMMWKIGNIVN